MGKHFRELLDGKRQRKIREWEKAKEEEEEEEITEQEIEEAIRKGKNKKAPGLDGIPNEAWKFATQKKFEKNPERNMERKWLSGRMENREYGTDL